MKPRRVAPSWGAIVSCAAKFGRQCSERSTEYLCRAKENTAAPRTFLFKGSALTRWWRCRLGRTGDGAPLGPSFPRVKKTVKA